MASGIRIIGHPPFAKDPCGRLRSRIATVFPWHRAIVTLPGIHATQRLAFIERLNEDNVRHGLSPLSRDEQRELWDDSVDLIIDPHTILIRPNPDKMHLAFQADEVLQETVSKYHIRFLHVLNRQVRDAIKRRGECWRISPLPRSQQEMKEMIRCSRAGIGGREIYYYSRATGTRFLTCDSFARLESLDDAELQKHLVEIAAFSSSINPHGSPEVAFFLADHRFSKSNFFPHDFRAIQPGRLRKTYEKLRRRFFEAVPPEFRHDDPDHVGWRNRLCAALIGREEEAVSEETLLKLSPEFYMQVEWLPGGRIEEGELIFDPIFDEPRTGSEHAEIARLCDEKARKFMFNFVREYGDLEYVNIGRVINSLSRRPEFRGRRDVYVAEIKLRDREREIVSVIRMQKWAVREHLDCGRPLLDAMIQSQDYTDYILDRRLACRQVGMNLPSRVTARGISECYQGAQTGCGSIRIWSPYFEREYIHGIATDKMPPHKFEDPQFATRFARLLGAAAAPNMIVGRCDQDNRVLFDDGDEIIVEDAAGMPTDLVVADQTGTFFDYLRDLQCVAQDYAAPVNRRLKIVPDPDGFCRIYLGAFLRRFSDVQQEYRKRRRAFESLFKHRQRDEAGSFAFRWEKVLERLDRTDPRELQRLIHENIALSPPRTHQKTVPVARAS